MPITVKVLYFGQAKEAAGRAEEEVSLPDSASIRLLVEHSKKAHPDLDGLSGVMRVAVNTEVAKAEDRLADGDVVAFLPPVAGG
ncbi:MAG: molybdopterin converting factor subunit 1 [Thaumarchaeota archaeon]|nr:molybdopterin converting factor subunit 1 [Nitrososphaerota archaeon]